MKFLSQFLARFPEVVEERGEYGVLCPAHDDRRPSLFFRLLADGRLLMRCWAGCDRDVILAKLGMSTGDLFDWSPGAGVQTSAKAVPGALGTEHVAALASYIDATAEAFQGPGPEAETARRYAYDRFGLDAERAADLGVGLDRPGLKLPFPYRSAGFERLPRLTVPMADFAGVPRGLQGRDLSGRCPARWMSLTNPDGAAWARWGYIPSSSGYDTVLVTESPGDGMTVAAVGYGVVMTRGASLAASPELAKELVEGLRGQDVVMAGDPDPAGDGFNRALADALREGGIRVRILPFPNPREDLTRWRENDPAAFPGELHAAVRRAPLHAAGDPAEHVPTPDGERESLLPLTDLGNAMRLFWHLGGHVRVVPGVGVLRWQGRHWAQVPTEALYADVRAVIRDMAQEAGHDPAALSKHATASQQAAKVRAMVDMLTSIPGVYATVDQFDARPDLLAFANGMVDLRTGALRPHDPQDMNTVVLDVDYVPGATAPRWERFLRECHPHSQAMPAFLRMLTGYGITGHGVERVFVMHTGPTTNGKTTYTTALEDVFRTAVKRADASLFQRRRESGGPRADVVGLRGRRLVISSEWPANMPLDQALMKAVTGDQTITARGVYARTEITFRPVCLVQVDTNYMPTVDATDAALWQRVRVVPWLEDFRGREDRHLQAALRREREGVAAWAVAGAIEWFREHDAGRGLAFPESVDRATLQYRDSAHPLAAFIGEEFVVEPDAFTPKSLAWERYRTWAEDSGIRHPMTRSKFYDAVRSVPGVVEAQGSGPHRGVRGFRHLADATEAKRPSVDAAEADIFGQAK